MSLERYSVEETPIYIVANLDRDKVSWANSFIESLKGRNIQYIEVDEIKAHKGDFILFLGDAIPAEIHLYDNYYVYFLAAAGFSRIEYKNITATHATIVSSNTEKKKIQKRWKDVSDKIYTMGFPISSRIIKDINDSWKPQKRDYVLFIGRGDIDKGIELELQIAKQLANSYHLVHITNTELAYREAMLAAGIRIIEKVEKRKYLQIVKGAICIINTSPKESLFISGVEAAMLGVPVLYIEGEDNAISEYSEYGIREIHHACDVIANFSEDDYRARNLSFHYTEAYISRLRNLFDDIKQKIRQTAVVLSPHSDDAVLSLAGRLNLYDKVYIFNFFSVSNSSIRDVGSEIMEISRMRQEEDLTYAMQSGSMITECGFPDCEVRGVSWRDVHHEDGMLQEKLQTYISEEIPPLLNQMLLEQKNIDVYIPLAVGMHPDHYLLLNAFLESEIRFHTRIKYYFYAEQPYYLTYNQTGLKLHAMYSFQNREALPFDKMKKESALRCYVSQLSDERIQRLLQEEYEYIWEIKSEREFRVIQDKMQRNNFTESFFCNEKLLAHIRKSYKNSKREFFEIERQKGCINIIIPLVMEKMLIGKEYYTVVRAQGCYSSDYFDIKHSSYLEKEDIEFMNAFLKKRYGAYLLWISNVRERAPLYYLLQGDNTIMYQGVSSHQIICSPRGIKTWLENQKSSIRKYFNRSKKFYSELQRAYDTISIKCTPANEKKLEHLLRLQQKRAREVEQLEDLSQDSSFVQLLQRCCQSGIFHSLELSVENRVISSLLLNIDESSRVISVYLQGFNCAYEQYAPSRLLFAYLIEYAHSFRYQCIDLLRGDESYKRGMCNAQTQLYKFIRTVGYKFTDEIIQYFINYVE